MVGSECRKGGGRNYSELVSSPGRTDGFGVAVGAWPRGQSTRVCTRGSGRAHACTGGRPGNTQVAAAAGCSRGCQRLQTLELDIWKQFNSLQSAFNKKYEDCKSSGGDRRGCS